MIYETIPAKYFDHTALAKAIGEGVILREFAEWFANKAANDLLDDDVTSGLAVNIGDFMNYAKNIEFLVHNWLESFHKIADEYELDIDYDIYMDNEL